MRRPRHVRRSRHARRAALLATVATLLLTVGCATPEATNSEHTVENGAQVNQGNVEIRDAFLVGGSAPTTKLYLAIYNSGSQADALTGVTSTSGSPSLTVVLPGGKVTVPGNGGIDLLESPTTALSVTGLAQPLVIGEEVQLTFSFTDQPSFPLYVAIENSQGL